MTHSPHDSLLQAMPGVDYSHFIGIDYEPPHGCFKLVDHIYKYGYGIDLGELDAGLEDADSHKRTARIQKKLSELAVEVETPEEGDVVIFKGRPWHIGLVVAPGQMIHSYQGGTSCIEDYNSIRWKSRIEGFYRYTLC